MPKIIPIKELKNTSEMYKHVELGNCHTGCEERRVKSDCFLLVFFLTITQ